MFSFLREQKLLEKWNKITEKHKKEKTIYDDGEIHDLCIWIETYIVNDFIDDIQNNKTKYHFLPNGYFVYDIQSISMGPRMICSTGTAIQVKITGRFTQEIKLIETHKPKTKTEDIIYKDTGETLKLDDN